MKVTVCFEGVKVVVPCGQGDMLIRDLANMAILRYQKSVGSSSQSRTPSKHGSTLTGVTSPENRSTPGSGQKLISIEKVSGISEESPFEVEALTLARDGGILDWDDRVVDVLDDREMLIAHIQTKHSKSDTGSDQSSHSISCLNATTSISTPIMSASAFDPYPTRCNGENDHQQPPESHKLPKHSQNQHIHRSGTSHASPTVSSAINSSTSPSYGNQVSSNQQSTSPTDSLPCPGQVKEIIKQLNFEIRDPPAGVLDVQHTAQPPPCQSSIVPQPTPPPPTPLRLLKHDLSDSGEYGNILAENMRSEVSTPGYTTSTFRGSVPNSSTCMRTNRPAPPPPPLHSKTVAYQGTEKCGNDKYTMHPGGLLAHVADTMCPISLSAEQFNQRYIGVNTRLSLSPELQPPFNTGYAELKDHISLPSPLPPPLQLRYPPGSLLPALPFPSNVCLPSSTSPTSACLNENPLCLMDSSTLSTVPEEEFDPSGSTSDHNGLSKIVPTGQSRVTGNLSNQSDQRNKSGDATTTTPTVSPPLSNSMRRASLSDSDGPNVPCSTDGMVGSNTFIKEPKLQCSSPPLPPPVPPPPLSAVSTPGTTNESADHVLSAPQTTLSTAHDRSTVSVSRSSRKLKRRRVPPPPPPVPPFRELDSQSGSVSDSESDELLMMNSATGHETHTICRRPLVTGSVPTSHAGIQEDVDSHENCNKSVANTKSLEHTLGASLDLRSLSHPESAVPNRYSPGTNTNVVMKSSSPPPISAHWPNPTDCVPGYTPRELAEAERSLQKLETSQHRESHVDRERQLSLDEDRVLLMKPAPPKRSPLTTLTGFSFLTPSNHLSSSETYGHRSTGDVCGGGGGRHFSGDSGSGGQFDAAGGGSGSSQDDVNGLGDDFQSARSSDTPHDAADHGDEDNRHDSSSLTSEELVDEQQRRAAAAEDEVLHMTELLSKRRESEARRHLMMAELEADMERDHRLRAAATAMALAAVSNMSPSRKARPHRYNTHSGRCSRHSRHGVQPTPHKGSIVTGDPYVAFREDDVLISITKTPSGLGFSLTTKPLRSAGSALSTGDTSGKELVAICVKNILPGGAALKEGQLRLGDRLLRVDDQDVSDKTQAEVVSILRVKPVGSVVQLLVRRQTPILETKSLLRNVPMGYTCPGCVALSSAGVKPCPDYSSYNSHSVCHAEHRSHPPPPRPKHKSHRQKLIDELAHRTHSQHPVCHALHQTKLPPLAAAATGSTDHRTGYRCASPPLPQRTNPLLDDLPDVTSMTNYPPYPDVMIFRLSIPLVSKTAHTDGVASPTPLTSTVSSSNASNEASAINTSVGVDGTVSATTNTSTAISRHMRLGVSVRETCSSQASKLAERLGANAKQTGDKFSRVPSNMSEEHWTRDLGADSVYGGVLVKGIIEGGAAHQDGRLRVGDELLEVDGIPLVNASSPLGLLRSVLRQLTSPPPTAVQNPASPQQSHTDDAIIQVIDASSQSGTKTDDSTVCGAASKPVPTVELLTARQMRHRRSASGHTLASNSEFWTDTCPGSTKTTTTVTCQTSNVPMHPELPSAANTDSLQLLSEHRVDKNSLGSGTRGSSHAMQIAADVHLHRCSITEDLIPTQTDSTANPGERETKFHDSGKSTMEAAVEKPVTMTTTTSTLSQVISDAPTRIN